MRKCLRNVSFGRIHIYDEIRFLVINVIKLLVNLICDITILLELRFKTKNKFGAQTEELDICSI